MISEQFKKLLIMEYYETQLYNNNSNIILQIQFYPETFKNQLDLLLFQKYSRPQSYQKAMFKQPQKTDNYFFYYYLSFLYHSLTILLTRVDFKFYEGLYKEKINHKIITLKDIMGSYLLETILFYQNFLEDFYDK